MPEKGAGRKEKEKTRKSDSFSLLLAPFSRGLRLRLARGKVVANAAGRRQMAEGMKPGVCHGFMASELRRCILPGFLASCSPVLASATALAYAEGSGEAIPENRSHGQTRM
jgi:hypothetical protein